MNKEGVNTYWELFYILDISLGEGWLISPAVSILYLFLLRYDYLVQLLN